MKKLIAALLLSACTHHCIIMPVEETKPHNSKTVFTSKSAKIIYGVLGVVAVAGGAGFAIRGMRWSTSLVDQSKQLAESIFDTRDFTIYDQGMEDTTILYNVDDTSMIDRYFFEINSKASDAEQEKAQKKLSQLLCEAKLASAFTQQRLESEVIRENKQLKQVVLTYYK